MDKDIKMNLIKGLLSGRLTKKQRRGYAELESVDKELKIQWNESGNKTIDLKIKEQIWEKVKARCIDRKKDKVLSELRWYFAVASLALLLTIGGLWVNSVRNNIEDEFIKVIAQQNQMYILPDSTKVWMEPGSSIKYAKAFNQKREVWLEGNSFFEVQTGRQFLPSAYQQSVYRSKGNLFPDPTNECRKKRNHTVSW